MHVSSSCGPQDLQTAAFWVAVQLSGHLLFRHLQTDGQCLCPYLGMSRTLSLARAQ